MGGMIPSAGWLEQAGVVPEQGEAPLCSSAHPTRPACQERGEDFWIQHCAGDGDQPVLVPDWEGRRGIDVCDRREM